MFGARQAAGNSIEDLTEVVNYAHTYGVQVLVTLNTLLHEDEYPQAVSLAHALYNIGVDALIIQDLHLLDFDLPPIRLHASTQCDNRTPEHISEVLAGRSANRGACAQFCRMAYDLLGSEGNEVLDEKGEPIHQRYLLSLQDLDRSAYLDELIEAGVTTFKIEGRLKDADYVTNITAYYREKLDRYQVDLRAQTASLTEHRPVFTRSFVPNPEKTFHRGGIDYFLHGRTPHMANWDTPKSTGEYIGEVLEARGNTLRVRLKEGVVLHNGDGLSIGNEGFNVNGVEGNIVKVNKEPTSISSLKGRGLYRNLDVEFVKNLKSERKIPVDVIFSETEDGFRICIGDKERSFVYAHEEAKNEQKAMETIRTQLSKLGDTPYIAREVKIESKPYFIPISVLNEWRRATIL